MDPTGKKTEFMDWGLPPGVSPQNPFGLQLPPGEPDEEMQRVMAEWIGDDGKSRWRMHYEDDHNPSYVPEGVEVWRLDTRGLSKEEADRVYEEKLKELDPEGKRWRGTNWRRDQNEDGGGFRLRRLPQPMSKDEPPDIIKLFVEGGFPAVAKMLRG